MRTLERIELPPTQAEDINPGVTTWRGGRLVSLDEGDYVSLFIAHEDAVVDEVLTEEDREASRPRHVVYAQRVRVPKPLTRDMAINAAEMSAYGLKNAMEVASFNAALARKSRLDAADTEVADHDRFIEWVRAKLTEIGV